MADNRTMAQLLQAPTEGYEDAIVIPEINANFELKHGLINLVQNKQFFGHDKEDPHAHIRYFNKITSTMRFPDVPSTSIKLMLFPFSLEGSARIWLEKEPSSFPILTRDDLALTAIDQDSLNYACVVELLDKMPSDMLEELSSVNLRFVIHESWAVVAKVSSNSSTPRISPDVVALTNRRCFKDDFENYVLATNDAVLWNMQNQGQGTLPTQTVTNPREHVNAITTRSGKTCEGPSTPLVPTPVVSTPLKEPEQNLETSMDRAKKTVSEPNSPNPDSYQPKLSYVERMKVRENDTPSAQQSRFMKLFKQLRLEIGLKDDLIEMPKFNKWLSTLLRNKEKLEEIAITTVNAECSAIILNKVPEKLEDPGKFLIPCALQELDRTNALANSGASINFLPHSIYKQLGLGALKPTRMTLELANHSVTHPMGIAEDVVGDLSFARKKLSFDYTRKINFMSRNRSDELSSFYAENSVEKKNKQFAHAISVIDFLKDEPFSGSTTNHSDTLPPSSSLVKTSDNLKEFADELTLLKKVMDEDVGKLRTQRFRFEEPVLLNILCYDKVECFDPKDEIDEIDAFLAMEVSSNFEEGYFDSEGDVIFLENLLSDDTTHNLAHM
ncbi:reverse transcriptase domain-containing protein [Tanacetum coccineum]